MRAHAPIRRVRIWPALLLACAGCATRRGAPPGPEVAEIRIQGARKLPASSIKKKIVTSERGPWPFSEKEFFDPNTWQADLRRIERYYQAQGYYQAQVLGDEVIRVDDDLIKLRVRVAEGEPTTISRVNVTGLEALPAEQRDRLLAQVRLRPGDVFREEDWANLKSRAQSALRELGYAEATAGGEVSVDLATRKALVSLELEPGQRYRFGQIHVADEAPVVQHERIIEQAQGALQPDGWYSESALAEAQARVFKMGVFGAVKVSRAAPDQATGTVPIVVDVREAPFHTERLGIGLGLDQTRNEGRISAEYTDRDFAGGLRRLTLRGKLGYAFLPNIYAVLTNATAEAPTSDVVFNVLTELEQPRLFVRDLRGQVSIGVERSAEPAFTHIGGKLRAGVIWQLSSNLAFYPSYNFEAYRLTGTAALGGNSPALVSGGCPNQAPGEACDIGLSYLEQVLEWDRRDNKAEPTRGFYLALSLQQGGGPLGGGFTFLRAMPDARYYASFLDDRLTLAARVRLGTLLPESGNDLDSPIVSRFFSGGGSSHRGFGSRRLSPLEVIQAAATSPGQTVPVGGNGLFEASLEARYRINDSLVAAVFLDAGFVTLRPFDFAHPRYVSRNMLYAVGFGFRYRTVAGPIRVDLAFRPNLGPPLEVIQPEQGLPYPIQTSCFGIGTPLPGHAGSPEPICSLHLSLGEAF